MEYSRDKQKQQEKQSVQLQGIAGNIDQNVITGKIPKNCPMFFHIRA